MESSDDSPFLRAFRGSFIGALRWHQLDGLWGALHRRADAGWYIYTVNEAPPREAASPEQLGAFIQEMDALLRRQHTEDYCGIVYADSLETPSFVKIYDPTHLGAVCGCSASPPLPGWVLSLLAPLDLTATLPFRSVHKRWWRRLFEH
jgi:hypothetical protein